MCRMLAVRSGKEFSLSPHLRKLADISRNSKEYQGHGWGCAWLEGSTWHVYKNIRPIWEDNLDQFGSTTTLIAHARSAFQDKGIVVENNMPFYDEKYVFVFNGQLSGVRITEEGRIGAEKIFNFIRRRNKGDMLNALLRGTRVIKSRSRNVKALNVIISDQDRFYVCCNFTEDPDYFAMWCKQDGNSVMVCSEPYPGETWEKIENNTTMVL